MNNYYLLKCTNAFSAFFLSVTCITSTSHAQGYQHTYYTVEETKLIQQQSIDELKKIIRKLKSAPEKKKLMAVNNFFNQKIRYADDVHLWRQSDYWATPLESMVKRAGDCEDIAIAKYMMLKALNIPVNKLRLSYVRVVIQAEDGSRTSRPHMIVAYYNTKNKDPLILDNMFKQMVPASLRPDLTHVYSFNEDNLWVGDSKKPKVSAQPYLSKWRDILARMRQQPSNHSLL